MLKPVACMQRHGEIEGCGGERQATDEAGCEAHHGAMRAGLAGL